MYLWHRIFIVITPWISFYLRLSFAKCQGNCEPLSLRRCILPDLISRIQPFFNIMLCRIFFYFCLFCHKCTSHLYLLSVWGMTKQGCMIHYRASTFFFFSLFLRKYIYHCQGHEFMHAVTKWKKELIFH